MGDVNYINIGDGVTIINFLWYWFKNTTLKAIGNRYI